MSAEICRRRLLTKETVVHNYQPSIKNCTSKFFELKKALESEDDWWVLWFLFSFAFVWFRCWNTRSTLAWDSAVKELDEYEFEVSKCGLTAKSCELEVEEYSKLYAQIEQQITDTDNRIMQLKKQWHDEKVIRSNKEDYEVLARKINEFSDRTKFEE